MSIFVGAINLGRFMTRPDQRGCIQTKRGLPPQVTPAFDLAALYQQSDLRETTRAADFHAGGD